MPANPTAMPERSTNTEVQNRRDSEQDRTLGLPLRGPESC